MHTNYVIPGFIPFTLFRYYTIQTKGNTDVVDRVTDPSLVIRITGVSYNELKSCLI